jgi:arsenite-transporting ATPase
MKQKQGRTHLVDKKLRASSEPAILPSTRYLFFGGKGGVGKTTAASAAALSLLERTGDGKDILLFSTDPAHSLSDSLGMEVGDRLTEVARHGTSRLVAREMNATAALAKFKERHRTTLSEIVERGTFFDESDVSDLLNLSLPGIDEVMALFELSEFDLTGSFRHVVVDTAPSGHTSQLLQLPVLFTRWVGALDRLAEKHRYMMAQFTRGRAMREDTVDIFLRELAERIQRVQKMLYDGEQASFTLVTVPTALIVEETSRYFALLQRMGVPVTDLIVNRIECTHEACPYCCTRATEQQPWLERISREFQTLRLHSVPLLATEIHGFDALRQFAQTAWETPPWNTSGKVCTKTSQVQRHAVLSRPLFDGGAGAERVLIKPCSLLVFGGKGGVGKTTAAAGTALSLAQSDSHARVLVFSTDPAHSLSDSFGEPIGELKRKVAGQHNLDAMEVESAKRFETLRDRYRARIDELFESLAANSRWQIQFDHEAMRELMEFVPPGMDEIVALSTLSELLHRGEYTTIVLDTAPTGHLLRFLELPQVALSWVRTFMKILLKYKDLVKWDGLAQELIALSKNIKRITALMTDNTKCEFIGVAIPEQMSLEESVRLTAVLKDLQMPIKGFLINNVIPPEAGVACGFCTSRRQAQEKIIESFQQKLGGIAPLYAAPQHPHEIRGAQRLQEHFQHWQPLPGTSS